MNLKKRTGLEVLAIPTEKKEGNRAVCITQLSSRNRITRRPVTPPEKRARARRSKWYRTSTAVGGSRPAAVQVTGAATTPKNHAPCMHACMPGRTATLQSAASCCMRPPPFFFTTARDACPRGSSSRRGIWADGRASH